MRLGIAGRLTVLPFWAALVGGCTSDEFQDTERQPRHIIYLHGQIVEDQGLPAFSERYGEYRFDEIVAAFGDAGFEVTAPLRDANADPALHAEQISHQIMAILDTGVPPRNITVVGASKGAYIASLVSDRMIGPELRYVLLAGCSDGANEQFLSNGHQLHRSVLAIRDRSDVAASGSCEPIAAASPALDEFREITTSTGLEHGLIYSPNPAWMIPTIAFAKGG